MADTKYNPIDGVGTEITLDDGATTWKADLKENFTNKAAPVGADKLICFDSADSDNPKDILISALPAVVGGLISWASVDMTGTAAINESINVSGIVDEATGDFTLSWTTDYANGTYSTAITSDDDGRSSGGHTVTSGIQDEAGKIGASCRYRCAANNVALDIDEITVITIGTSS